MREVWEGGDNNIIQNYMYKNNELYSYDKFEYQEYGDISGVNEEQWFDEYKKSKLKYISEVFSKTGDF